jgi:hypothetical protein
MCHEKKDPVFACFCFMRVCSHYIEYGFSSHLAAPSQGT